MKEQQVAIKSNALITAYSNSRKLKRNYYKVIVLFRRRVIKKRKPAAFNLWGLFHCTFHKADNLHNGLR